MSLITPFHLLFFTTLTRYKLNNLDTLREESETPYSSDTSEEGRVSTRPARGSQDNLLNSLKDRFRTPTRFSKGEYVLPHPLDDLMDVDTIVSKYAFVFLFYH